MNIPHSEPLTVAAPATCEAAGDLGPARSALAAGDFGRAWAEASAAVDLRPFHPEGFLLLSELAARAGDLGLAHRCALRAAQLTPNWAEAVQAMRRHSRPPGQGDRGPAAAPGPAPAALGRDPIRSPTLSVCMIVRNEERFLDRCLASVQGLAAQVVVVDTGSTDRTVEIALAHGAEVHHFVWCDDFSAARNSGLVRARGDWILVLDADEEVSAEGRLALAMDLRLPGMLGLRIPIVEAGSGERLRTYVPRLVRNTPGVRFVGRIHEDVLSALAGTGRRWGLQFGLGRTLIIHHGYSAQVVLERRKGERNLKLLDEVVRGAGDSDHLRFQLALELCRSGKLEEGLGEYEKAFVHTQARGAGTVSPEAREALLAQYSTFLQQAGRPAEIERLLTSPLAASRPLTASLTLMRGLARIQLGRLADACADLRDVIRRREEPGYFVRSPALDSAMPEVLLGSAEERSRNWAAAETAFAAALAREPGNVRAVCGRARVRAATGDVPGALAGLESFASTPGTSEEPWITGARIALDAPGLAEVADHWTAVACERFPSHPVLGALRGVALLYRGDAEDAHSWFEGLPGVADPSVRAASVIAALVSEKPLPGVDAAEVGPVSVALVATCAALRRNGATALLERLHSGVGRLATVLPGAAGVLRSIGAPSAASA